MYLYEVYIDDGWEHGGNVILSSKTKYSKDEFRNVVSEAKKRCEGVHGYEIVGAVGKILLSDYDFDEVEFMHINLMGFFPK